MHRHLTTLGTVLAIGVVAVGTHTLRTSSHEARQAAQRYEAVYYLPPADALRWFSLGYDEALADLIWMRALVYFGQEFEHHGNVEHVFGYAEAMVALDPRFLAVYRWVGVAGLYRPEEVTPRDIRRSIDFMKRGQRLFPEDGELAWDLGAALVYELVPYLDEEAARLARAEGSPYLMTAVRLGAAPEWAALSNAANLVRVGQNEQAARHLEEMYASTRDPTVRAQIASRIRELRTQAEADAFMAAMEELETLRRRDFPYLPAGLYLLVGERPPEDLETPISVGLPTSLAAEGSP
ncbi:MAG: hypothetical protein AB8I08_25200 [Sandaracinaceae bacterium]